jgi:hypothetical protein
LGFLRSKRFHPIQEILMKFFGTLMKAGLPALAIAIAAPAFAQTGASASAGSLGYELIDLDTSDGVASSLVFLDSWTISTHAFIYRGASTDTYPLALLNAFGPGTSALNQAGAEASAWASWTDVASSAEAHQNMATSTALWRRGFVLSPNTEVKFFALGEANADAGEWYANWAVAGLVLKMDGSQQIQDLIDVRNGEGYTGWMNTSAASYGAAAVQGWVANTTYTESYAMAAPVPEPATPAMLFGGLGLLAAAGLRKRIR